MSICIGTPHARGAGYFVNDQKRADKQQDDIQTCPHCQAVIKMREWRASVSQNFCIKCMKPACNRPECDDCVPFMKQVEQAMESQMRFQKMGGPSAPDSHPVSIFTG